MDKIRNENLYQNKGSGTVEDKLNEGKLVNQDISHWPENAYVYKNDLISIE